MPEQVPVQPPLSDSILEHVTPCLNELALVLAIPTGNPTWMRSQTP